MGVHKARLEAIVRLLDEEGSDGLLAVNDGHNFFLESHPVFVLSGVRPIGESALLVDRTGSSILIVTPSWDFERASAASHTARTIGTDDLPGTIASVLQAQRIKPGRTITVGLPTVGIGLVRQIENILGGPPPSKDGFIRDLARIRSPDEIAAVQKATRIAEQGYGHMLKCVRPGMREFELAGELHCFMKALGAEDNFLMLSASQHNRAIRAAGSRVLDVGDIVLSEISPCYQGQFSQICRTAIVGEATQLMRDKYTVLQAAMLAGRAAAVPGAAVRDVAAAMDDCIREAGYGDYCRPPYMRVRGHGLGITSDLPGDITTDNEVQLEEGMVFVMHPNQYLPETGYLMCGEPVIVTRDGAKALTTRTAEFDSIYL